MQYTHLLFDLDGTLTDPAEGITRSVQYALAHFNIHEPDLDKLLPFIGPPLHDTLVTQYGFTEEDAWKGVGYYREYYSATGIRQNQLFAGIPELLQLLRKQQRQLFVATSKPIVFARQVLEHFSLQQYFHFTYGSELDGTRADKTSLTRYILDQHQLDVTNTLMIGDRQHDIIGAVNNHIHSAGIGYGYGSREELTTAGCTYYYPTVDALAAAFETPL